MSNLPLKLAGSVGSPYSRKMLSLMRFRRISHIWIFRRSKEDADTPPGRDVRGAVLKEHWSFGPGFFTLSEQA